MSKSPIERAAEAVRATREFQAGAAFGIPGDAYSTAAGGIARAVFESIDRDFVAGIHFGEGWDGPYADGTYARGSRVWLAYQQADALKAALLTGGES